MSNGAEIRFRIKKIEVQKEDAIFEFLPTNTDNCGFLFSIDAERKISNCEKAFMAKKFDRNDIVDENRNKKVSFDEKVIMHTCKNENNMGTEQPIVKYQKKEKLKM